MIVNFAIYIQVGLDFGGYFLLGGIVVGDTEFCHLYSSWS